MHLLCGGSDAESTAAYAANKNSRPGLSLADTDAIDVPGSLSLADTDAYDMSGSILLADNTAGANMLMATLAFKKFAEGRYMSARNLLCALRECRPRATRAQAQALLETFDVNNDGVLELDEFQEIVRQNDDMQKVLARETVARVSARCAAYFEILRGCTALAKYLLLVVLFMTVILWQNEHASEAKSIGDAMRQTLFADVDAIAGLKFTDESQIYDWLRSTMEVIFTDPVCGDGFCEAPEEFASFEPAPGSARDFSPCPADCPTTETVSVVVHFDDAFKLRAAAEVWEVFKSEAYMGYDAESWGATGEPVVGWNVCSKDHREVGFLVPVCLFDGDVFIHDLPYRSAELNASDATFFSMPFSLELFPGHWEVRIALSGFDFADSKNLEGIPSGRISFAYPAVGGTVTVAGQDAQRWAPCPNAAECSNLFYRGMYVSSCKATGRYKLQPNGSYVPVTFNASRAASMWDFLEIVECEWRVTWPGDFDMGMSVQIPAAASVLVPLFNLAETGINYSDPSEAANFFLGTNFGTHNYSEFGTVSDGFWDYSANAVWQDDGWCDPLMNSVFGSFDGKDCCCAFTGGTPEITGCSYGEVQTSPIEAGCRGPLALFNSSGWDFCYKSDAPFPTPLECNFLDQDELPKYPFTAWQAFKQIVEFHEGEGAFDMTRLPSVLCPDCDITAESYRSIPFVVNSSGTPTSTTPFPSISSSRQRFIGKNMVVMGPVMSTTRHQARQCDARARYFVGALAEMSNLCAGATTTNTNSFGVDATLAKGSTNYRESNWEASIFTPSAFELYPELNTTSPPPGFYLDQRSGRGANVKIPFAVAFDTNWNLTKSLEIVSLLEEGSYIDDLTAEVRLRIPSYNAQAGLWALTTITSMPEPGGLWAVNVKTSDLGLLAPRRPKASVDTTTKVYAWP